MDDRFRRGVSSLLLAVLMLFVGQMAERFYPQETAYVFSLFLFGSMVFLADAAVTMTRVTPLEASVDDRRESAATPWRIAFAVCFVLALIGASRTGSSFVTLTAVLLAVLAAGMFLVKRRFFGNLRELISAAGRRERPISKALAEKDHAALARLLEEKIDQETDPSRRNTLLLSLGAVYVVRGEYDRAAHAFERIDRSVREKTAEGRLLDMGLVADLNLASAHIAAGNFDRARECLDRIPEERLPEEFRSAWEVNRSALLVGTGAHEEVIRFVEAMPLDTMPPRSRLPFLRDLAEALAASDIDKARALAAAESCLAIDEGAQSQNVMALVRMKRAELDEAEQRLLLAREKNPDGKANLRVHAETLYYQGLLARARGLADDARSFFAHAASVKGGGRFSSAAARENAT